MKKKNQNLFYPSPEVFLSSMKKALKNWESEQWPQAQQAFEKAYKQASHPFTKSYAAECISNTLAKSASFKEATSWAQEALEFIKKVPWQEGEFRLLECLSDLARQVGDYEEAEKYLRALLKQCQDPFFKEKIALELSQVLMEQSRYTEARSLIKEYWIEEAKTPFERVLKNFRLKQIANALGQFFPQEEALQKDWEALNQGEKNFLKPYDHFLEGQASCLRGRYDEGQGYFKQASQLFGEREEILGQVEALLALTQPLMEFGLHAQASKILEDIFAWGELQSLPALAHSLKLRRVALSAFYGEPHGEDFESLKQALHQRGRREDWLKFWFHLSLAARQKGQEDFFKAFILQARSLLLQTAESLNESDRQSFLNRPDFRRVLYLAASLEKSEEASVSLGPSETESTADLGSVAPPDFNHNEVENEK